MKLPERILKEMNNNLILNGIRCERVKTISTDWSIANFYLLPEEYRFECEWEYTVESFAGDRLYKYSETRKVEQKATYISVTLLKDGSLHEIKICDQDNVVILERNITDPETLEKYRRIIKEVKDSVAFSIFIKESMELEEDESVSFYIKADDFYTISAFCDEQGVNCELTVDDEIVENVFVSQKIVENIFVSEKTDVPKAIFSLMDKISLTPAEKLRYQEITSENEE